MTNGSSSVDESVSCDRIAPVLLGDWVALDAAMAGAHRWQLDQAWLPATDRRFEPAEARVAWTREALVILGTLRDRDVFNPVEDFNEPSFQLGDVFEVFIKPSNQEAYFEFHVSPHNQVMQLRWPAPPRRMLHADKLRVNRGASSEMLQPYKVSTPRIATATRSMPDGNGWQVWVEIPLKMMMDSPASLADSRWRLSLSRYDYTRGEKRPVLSSTSSHSQLDFHRVEDWQDLVLVEPG